MFDGGAGGDDDFHRTRSLFMSFLKSNSRENDVEQEFFGHVE